MEHCIRHLWSSAGLDPFYVLTHLAFTTVTMGVKYNHPVFTEEETGAWRGTVTRLRSPSQGVAELRFEPR